MTYYAQILLPRPFDKAFCYEHEMKLEIGDIVKVPFGNNEIWGVVWSLDETDFNPQKIKKIIEKSVNPPISQRLIKFIEWVANYNLAPLGSVLAMVISVKDALEKPKPKIGYVLGSIDEKQLTAKRKLVAEVLGDVAAPFPVAQIASMAGVSDAVVRAMIGKEMLVERVVDSSFYLGEKVRMRENNPLTPALSHKGRGNSCLSPEQQEIAIKLCANINKNNYNVTVIDGVTGSGKTEVYFEAIADILDNGGQVLVMLPEIALTTQLIERFYKRFGSVPTSWHSALTPAQRRENWRDIASGGAKLIIGARSSLFLPYADLGLIIVDEEHESAFKQEEGVIYHGRDMAVARAFIEDIPAILASASPSLETVFNIKAGKYECLHLPNRYGEAILPEIEAIDMRKEKLPAQHWLSNRMKEALLENITLKQQSLLYLNRRGYAPLTLCRTCGFRFACPDCTSWLVSHQPPYGRGYLQCHHCGYRKPIVPKCPDCDNETLASCGPGVERLKEEVEEIFPNARIAMMTSDNISSLSHAGEIVNEIESGKIDIIIGTQMIAKGYNFPNLTLVGVVDADLGLEGGDMRAAERSYQLLHQVSGRAGRHHLKGRALVQTYMPDNLVMQALLCNDRDSFNDKELERRRYSHVPPYSKMAAIIVSGKIEMDVLKLAKELMRFSPIDRSAAAKIKVLGPAPAPLLLLRGNFRYRILVISDREINIQNAIKDWLTKVKIPSNIRIKLDIDPYNFM